MEPSRENPYRGGKNWWPWGMALGILTILVGLAFSWEAAAVGVLLTAVCSFFWVQSLSRTRTLLEAPPPEEEGAAPREPGSAAPDQQRYGRAAFLGVTTLGLSQVIGGVVTLPILGFMVLPPFLKQSWNNVDIGPLDLYPEGKWLVVTFLENPAQGEVSRKTAFVRNNGFLGKQPSYTIISNHCAHLGCPVQPSAPLSKTPKQYKAVTLISLETNPSGFGCPCHGGQYSVEGNRTAGPPVRALDRYSYSIVDGHLVLGTPYSVSQVEGAGADAKITKYKREYPGIHVDGIESWLYPITPPTG